ASCPAGPPSGPAKRACPPNRATATAALAAQPPPTETNSVASPFVSATGNSSTRKTSSRTAIPVQRMRGARDPRLPLAEDTAPLLQPRPNDVMCDRNRRRSRKPIWVLLQQHLCDRVTFEPTGALEFAVIDHDVGRCRLRMASDHQRHRKGPRLRGE